MRAPFLLSLWLACASPFILSPAFAQTADAPRPQISVTGQGSAFAVPDMAMITLGVTAQAKEAAAAMDDTSGVTEAILDRLGSFDIDPRDMQTSDLSLNPVWSNRTTAPGQPPVIEGYEASNRITVRVRELDRLGDVLGAVLGDGANRLSGLSFGLQDPAPLLDQARKDAVADAIARAQTYAEAAGMTLGSVLSISEGGGGVVRPEMAMSMRDAPVSVPVAQGETGISASVNMVFTLE